MSFRTSQNVWPTGIVVATLLLGLGLSLAGPADVLRERVFDGLLQRTVASTATNVVVVDIDSASLEQLGDWPWSRDRLAELVDRIADASPKVLGLDMLLLGDDERSGQALARRIAATTANAETVRLATSLAAQLPDTDRRLADALRRVPTALALGLDDDPKAEAPAAVPMIVGGRPDLSTQWVVEGAIGSIPAIAEGARGHGVLLLPQDADDRVRRVPLIVATSTSPRPGLALEVVRLAAGASTYVLRAPPTEIVAGTIRLRMASDAMLRLRPVPVAVHEARSIPAQRLFSDAAVRERLRGRIVLLGISAGHLGGLRPSGSGQLVPSVQIQADAIEQMLRADAPRRTSALPYIEVLAALGLTLLVVTLTLRRAPLGAGAAMLALAGTWLAISAVSINRFGILLDPLLVPGTLLAGYGAAALTAATQTRRREARVRRRFEQHLAPEIVRRIVEQPGLLKLEGEAREITALFTDIEGFTSMTERAGPVDLIAILDRYIDGASRIVVEHGGMVEKVVGDGLHVIFNAPLSLADHPRRALECALALHAFSDRLRQEPDAVRIGLGRTRIGIETGPVIVGDVGGGRRLDYTAHGNAMNRAARLEAANKELGSTICIGPGAAAALAPGLLRPLGVLDLRGVQGGLKVYTTWPQDADAPTRQAYLEALAQVATDPAAAGVAFRALAGRLPTDGVIAVFAKRYAGLPQSG